MAQIDKCQAEYDARMPLEDDCRNEIYWHHVDEEEAIICDDPEEALDAVIEFFAHIDEWDPETLIHLASIVNYNTSVPFHMRHTPIATIVNAAVRWKAEQTVTEIYGPRNGN